MKIVVTGATLNVFQLVSGCVMALAAFTSSNLLAVIFAATYVAKCVEASFMIEVAERHCTEREAMLRHAAGFNQFLADRESYDNAVMDAGTCPKCKRPLNAN